MSCKHEKYISTGVYSSDDECESCGLLRSTVEASKPMSLQKESEWEKEFDKKFWIYFVQYYPEKENGLFGSIKSFIYQTIANREKEIAEEVENIDINLLDDEYIDVKTFRKKVLSILKH